MTATLRDEHEAVHEPAPATEVPAPARSRDRNPRWWREVITVVAFYCVYSFVRGQFGSSAVAPARALANANAVIGLEQRLGIANELAVQRWFLQWPAVVRGLDIFYGMFHFAVPIAVLVLLYRRAPARYRQWRNVLAATTGLALVGFSLFPLMPPRLLCACPYGAGTDYGFVDTLDRFGGLWSFGSHGMSAVSNQYAAMPSLHFAWALWSAVAVWPVVRRRVPRLVVAAYPTLTLVTIIVTANHFWLDAFGGAAVLAAGWVLAVAPQRIRHPWRSRADDAAGLIEAVP